MDFLTEKNRASRELGGGKGGVEEHSSLLATLTSAGCLGQSNHSCSEETVR